MESDFPQSSGREATRHTTRFSTGRGGSSPRRWSILLIAGVLIVATLGLTGVANAHEPPENGIEFPPCSIGAVRNLLDDLNNESPEEIGHCEEHDETWYFVPGPAVPPLPPVPPVPPLPGVPNPLPDPAGDAQAEGRVFFVLPDGNTVMASGAFVQMERLVDASGEFLFQAEENAYGYALLDTQSHITQPQAVYRIMVQGGGAIYRACAYYPGLSGSAESMRCTPGYDIEQYRHMGDLLLPIDAGANDQGAIMDLVPTALNCAGHNNVAEWLAQVGFDADCNTWSNVEELRAGCNPFNPTETPASPQGCTGPSANSLDPEDPESVNRFIAAILPAGMNCGKNTNPVDIVLQFALDPDCDSYHWLSEAEAVCNPLSPFSHPGNHATCHPLPSEPNGESLRKWVEETPGWVQGQQPFLLLFALSMLHPWALWFVGVLLPMVTDALDDLPDLPVP